MEPVCWRLEQLTETQYYATQRQIVSGSPFWDENYYFCHYSKDILKSKLNPLDHYLQLGWKQGYNPSSLVDGSRFGQYYKIDSNPLVFYLQYGRFGGCGLPNVNYT